MRVELLHVPGCPSAGPLLDRLAELLEGRPDAYVQARAVATVRQAAETGMTGSPTLLIDGTDPFRTPGATPSVSCRLYRNEDGQVTGLPSSGQLRAALAREV